MRAEIVAIGTELTTGAKLDTNSQWLSIELSAIGIPVHYHTTMADDLEAMVQTLRTAVHRSDLVIITGGLGPTLDDLTRQAMAELAQAPLELDPASLEHVRSMFARRRRVMPERNVIQAMFPKGSEPIPNPRGTAPGIWMTVSRKDRDSPCQMAALPGVPAEMKPMYFESVLPRLPAGARVIRRARLNCFGIGESDCEQMLGEITARGRDPEVGITAHEATITLRIEAHGRSAEECEGKIQAAKAEIRQRLSDALFGEEDEELEHVLVPMLAERQLRVAVVETATGGLLALRLSSVPGSDSVFRGGLVLPSSAFHAEPPPEAHGVHWPASLEERVRLMARIGLERFGCDYALAVGEAPSYDAANTSAPVPSLYLAMCGRNVEKTFEQVLLGDLTLIRSRAAKGAMNLLRRHLLGEPR